MKKFSVIPVAALMLGIVFSAFNIHLKENKPLDPMWYYKLTTTVGENDRTNYELWNNQNPLCPGSSSVRCVIQAPEFGSTGTPDLSHIDQIVSKKP